ncbi:MAG: EamA family transporter, partial [Gammaproteobacteria bacterium]|nr:EamA family transporter [Gammaproteobacteria bacterium]
VASAGVVYMSYPLFVVLLARLLVGQRISARAAVGAVLVLGGAALVNTPGAIAPD